MINATITTAPTPTARRIIVPSIGCGNGGGVDVGSVLDKLVSVVVVPEGAVVTVVDD